MENTCSTSIPHNQLERSLQALTTTSRGNHLNRAIEYLRQVRGNKQLFPYTDRLVFSPTPEIGGEG